MKGSALLKGRGCTYGEGYPMQVSGKQVLHPATIAAHPHCISHNPQLAKTPSVPKECPVRILHRGGTVYHVYGCWCRTLMGGSWQLDCNYCHACHSSTPCSSYVLLMITPGWCWPRLPDCFRLVGHNDHNASTSHDVHLISRDLAALVVRAKE